MSDPKEAVVKALLDEGGAPGSSLHSWRCEYPDRYGPCDCVEQTAEFIIETLRAVGFGDLSGLAEQLRKLVDEWERNEVKAMFPGQGAEAAAWRHVAAEVRAALGAGSTQP